MANVKQHPATDGPPRSARGRYVIRETQTGLIAQAWPRKRGPGRTFAAKWREGLFKYAARWSANAEPRSYYTAEHWVRGSDMMPRDLLTQLAYGRGITIINPDGTEWAHWSHRPPEVSKLTPIFEGLVTNSPAELNVPAFTNVFIAWDPPAADTVGLWKAANPTRFTVPANGLVLQCFAGTFCNDNGSGTSRLSWALNGGGAIAQQLISATGPRLSTCTTGPILLPAGSYLEVRYLSTVADQIQSHPATFAGILVTRLA